MPRPRAAPSVMGMDLFVIAGVVSTTLFTVANVPMLVKAVRTQDLTSYSLGSLLIGNAANAVHTVYVASLPFGPIWLLHGFYVASMLLMLALYVRYRRSVKTAGRHAVGARRRARVARPLPATSRPAPFGGPAVP